MGFGPLQDCTPEQGVNVAGGVRGVSYREIRGILGISTLEFRDPTGLELLPHIRSSNSAPRCAACLLSRSVGGAIVLAEFSALDKGVAREGGGAAARTGPHFQGAAFWVLPSIERGEGAAFFPFRDFRTGSHFQEAAFWVLSFIERGERAAFSRFRDFRTGPHLTTLRHCSQASMIQI